MRYPKVLHNAERSSRRVGFDAQLPAGHAFVFARIDGQKDLDEAPGGRLVRRELLEDTTKPIMKRDVRMIERIAT